MRPALRAPLFTCVFFVLAGGSVLAQDIAVRTEAERLLERASGVSHPVHAVHVKSEVRFRTYAPDGSTRDGRLDSIHAGDIETAIHKINDLNPQVSLSPHFLCSPSCYD